MSTIEEFINQNLGRPNVTPKGLILEAYAMGLSHGKGEEYEPVPEEDTVEEVVQEEEATGEEELEIMRNNANVLNDEEEDEEEVEEEDEKEVDALSKDG